MVLADPEFCFGKPKLVAWNGKLMFVCQRSAVFVEEGYSFQDEKGNHFGLFATPELATETRDKNAKWKAKENLTLVSILNETYKPKPKASSANGEAGAQRNAKPVYLAFISKKVRGIYDTELLGKCPDPIAFLHKLREVDDTSNLQLKIDLFGESEGNAGFRAMKTSAGPILTITSDPSKAVHVFKLVAAMEEAKKLKGGKGKGKAAATPSPPPASPVKKARAKPKAEPKDEAAAAKPKAKPKSKTAVKEEPETPKPVRKRARKAPAPEAEVEWTEA